MRKTQFLFVIGFLLLVSSVFATQRMVVGEVFSSTSCSFCPTARSALKQLDDNVDYLVPLIWDSGASPNAGARYTMYEGEGVPHAQFGGTERHVGSGDAYNTYLGFYEDLEEIDSPIDLGLTFGINNNGEVSFSISAELTDDISTSDNKLIFLVTQYISDSYFSLVTLYHDVDFTLTTTGDTDTYTHSMALDPSWDPSTVRGVVLVQSLNEDDDYIIHQAAMSDFLANNATVSGTVVNGFNNQPMADVDVYADGAHAVTDANGTFSFDFVAPFTRYFKFSKYGYGSVAESRDLLPGDDINLDITLNEIVIAPDYAETDIDFASNNVTVSWDPPGLLDEFTEDFEDTSYRDFTFSTNTERAGWQIMTSSSSAYFTIPMIGSYFIGVNDDAGGENGADSDGSMDYMILPEMDLSQVFEAQLTFMSYYTAGYGQLALIEVSTDGGANWELVALTPPASSWTSQTINLGDFCGPGYESTLIAFHSSDGGGWATGWGVDDIVLNSAGGTHAGMHGYNLYLDGADTPANGTTPVTDLSYTFNGLSVGEHTVEIAAVYDTGESEYFMYNFTLPPEELFPPFNLTYTTSTGMLSWEAPTIPEDRVLAGYKVYIDSVYIESVTEAYYQVEEYPDQSQHIATVTAEYTDGYESEAVSIDFTYETDNNNAGVNKFVTELSGNYPNPFNPLTKVSFSLKEAAPVTLEIYSVKGQKVKTLAKNRVYGAGHNTETWNGTDDNAKSVASGVYFLRMTTKDYSKMSKMVLMK